ncbi:glutathione peroxidase [Glaciecola punicea ACAM 611]|uniref:Glutathione peroxidase n=2 Tax=Glaciecola TaxID=89404 RepID=H5TA61_9ALTE|nr:glutathione peroxidase [Glaciecola punicea ACAM 611]
MIISIMANSIYDLTFTNNKGESVALQKYADKVVLIVNTASKCGFTSQYKGLEDLYKKYNAQGFEIIGFPCDQFGGQEPGSDTEIEQFCQLNYGVSFTLSTKVEVNGENTHPFYQHLKQQAPGVLGSQGIKWNFTKFLVAKDGSVKKRYASATRPEALNDDIIKMLQA